MTSQSAEGHVPVVTLGRRLRMAMEDAGYSVNQMAALYGKDRKTIGGWLSNRHAMSPVEFEKWIELTGCNAQWLRTGMVPTGGGGGPRKSHPQVEGSSARRDALGGETDYLEVIRFMDAA